MTEDPLLTGPQAADRLGIEPSTWRAYVSRGQAPPPDDPDLGQIKQRRNPRWRQSVIDEIKARKRQPKRTDPKDPT